MSRRVYHRSLVVKKNRLRFDWIDRGLSRPNVFRILLMQRFEIRNSTNNKSKISAIFTQFSYQEREQLRALTGNNEEAKNNLLSSLGPRRAHLARF
jgi:hypothetical protein